MNISQLSIFSVTRRRGSDTLTAAPGFGMGVGESRYDQQEEGKAEEGREAAVTIVRRHDAALIHYKQTGRLTGKGQGEGPGRERA